jgi:hypothetical protein
VAEVVAQQFQIVQRHAVQVLRARIAVGVVAKSVSKFASPRARTQALFYLMASLVKLLVRLRDGNEPTDRTLAPPSLSALPDRLRVVVLDAARPRV